MIWIVAGHHRGLMLNSPAKEGPQRIVVLNPKGGCGKTTIATNLASYFASHGPSPTLIDCDPAGYSMRWLERRSPSRPRIHGIAACENAASVTRTWRLQLPPDTRHAIVDSPAGIANPQIHELIYDASNVIIPILPSAIDIRTAVKFIADLLLVAKLDRDEVKVGIVANRTRKNTKSLAKLMRFLTSLRIPVVATLRDSQNYVEAVGRGIGVYDLPRYRSRHDTEQLARIIAWLNRRHDHDEKSPAQPIHELPDLTIPRILH